MVLVSAATMGILVDWAQTRQALHQGWGERNPILGSHPSDGKLAVYNVLAIASTVSLGALLPSRWRTAWFGGGSWHGQHVMRISVINWWTRDVDVDRSLGAIRSVLAASRDAG